MDKDQEGKPRQVVHIGTTITTQFGYVDEAGNLHTLTPIQLSSILFESKFFEETFKRLSDERDKLKCPKPSES